LFAFCSILAGCHSKRPKKQLVSLRRW
jgi:hypothetical protein